MIKSALKNILREKVSTKFPDEIIARINHMITVVKNATFLPDESRRKVFDCRSGREKSGSA